MREVSPQVFLAGRSVPDYAAFEEYLEEVGGLDWLVARREDGEDEYCRNPDGPSTIEAQALVEFGGRLCYRSWKEGLNPNVTKIRADQDEYLRNILKSRHGSVLEHVSYSFVFHNVSRVLTHELVRHRAGTAISQESMRFVRLDDIGFWLPEWAKQDEELAEKVADTVARLEWLQKWMAGHFGLDEPGVPFSEKKAKTSFMRRLAPEGVATGIMWTANVRALRHVIEARTAVGAEEEIRLVFGEVGRIMKAEAPALFGDFTEQADGAWAPEWSKV